MIATVVKRVIVTDDGLRLFGGTEVNLDPHPATWEGEQQPYYHGSVYNCHTPTNVRLTMRQAEMWLVFRRAVDLGY